jgi:DNA-binding protein HU-beta
MAGKADIVDSVVSKVDGITKKQATEAFDAIFDCVTDYLKSGDRVQIGSFGSFSVSERASRKGRNPATGASITIPASKNVRFKPASTLKESVNKKRKK